MGYPLFCVENERESRSGLQIMFLVDRLVTDVADSMVSGVIHMGNYNNIHCPVATG